jgi:hypothetical protein
VRFLDKLEMTDVNDYDLEDSISGIVVNCKDIVRAGGSFRGGAFVLDNICSHSDRRHHRIFSVLLSV